MNDRYSRQVLFGEIGSEGQDKLAESSVLVVGCGALGAAHAEALARAGIGHIRLADRDFVEHSNLQRQSLYTESDARNRLPKAAAAAKRLGRVNSEITIESHVEDINSSNIENLLDGVDVAIDGSDNFELRYLLNDACLKHSVPWVYGAAVSSYGSTMTIRPGTSPCLRCIFEEIPDPGSSPTCETSGVIHPIIATISAVQVTETLKLLTNNLESLHNSILQIDIWQNDWRSIKLGEPNPDCPSCGLGNFEFLDRAAASNTASLCGRNAVQILPPAGSSLDLAQLAERLSALGEVTLNKYLLRFTNAEIEITVFSDARAIVSGTDDPAVARTAYSKYVGA